MCQICRDRKWVRCPQCFGDGNLCTVCYGKGEVRCPECKPIREIVCMNCGYIREVNESYLFDRKMSFEKLIANKSSLTCERCKKRNAQVFLR